VPLRPAQFQRASQVFDAFRGASPESLAALAADGLDDFPGLAAAIKRHLQELSWIAGGLSRTERQVLEACAARPVGATLAYPLAHQRVEERVFLGDTVFAWHLRRMARPPVPLLTIEGPPGPELEGHTVAATEPGRAVLAGELDAVRARGLDRWLGGVYLSGRHPPWRWDPDREALRALHAYRDPSGPVAAARSDAARHPGRHGGRSRRIAGRAPGGQRQRDRETAGFPRISSRIRRRAHAPA
jgi:hypothetical protein